MRSLGAALQADGSNTHFLHLPIDTQTLEHDCLDCFVSCDRIPLKPAIKKLAMSMASRPALHPLLQAAVEFYYQGLLRHAASRRVDAIHFVGTGWDISGFALAMLASQKNVPFTVWPAVHPGSWGDDAIDMRLYRQADTVFCQTHVEAEHLVRRGIEPERISICGLPPNVSADGGGKGFRARLTIGVRPAVLFMGRRDEGKGYPALLKAWPIVLQRFPDAVLLLAGKGGEEYAYLLGLLPCDSCRDMGIVDDATKADALAACDLFCLPSAHESFGIVYVEAWFYSKPVICGTAPACRELVQDGVTGLHSTQNPEELADKICSLLADKDLAKRMGDHGKILQQERFTKRRLVECHASAWRLH
jgi:glycosyltransferase involved in cell wall biosynthesis